MCSQSNPNFLAETDDNIITHTNIKMADMSGDVGDDPVCDLRIVEIYIKCTGIDGADRNKMRARIEIDTQSSESTFANLLIKSIKEKMDIPTMARQCGINGPFSIDIFRLNSKTKQNYQIMNDHTWIIEKKKNSYCLQPTTI